MRKIDNAGAGRGEEVLMIIVRSSQKLLYFIQGETSIIDIAKCIFVEQISLISVIKKLDLIHFV